MTRKTLSLPVDLADRLAAEAAARPQSFNSFVKERLTALFLPETVGQFEGAGIGAARKARGVARQGKRGGVAQGPEGIAAPPRREGSGGGAARGKSARDVSAAPGGPDGGAGDFQPTNRRNE